jgi:hypothetical protein
MSDVRSQTQDKRLKTKGQKTLEGLDSQQLTAKSKLPPTNNQINEYTDIRHKQGSGCQMQSYYGTLIFDPESSDLQKRHQ